MPPSGETRGGFKFRADRLALDFAATLAKRFHDEPEDLLATPEDLGRWLMMAGLAEEDPLPTDEDLAAARALRESLYRLAISTVDGKPHGSEDLARVNRWAAVKPPGPQLGAEGLTWVFEDVGSLLAAVARDGVELLGGDLAKRIRRCQGTGCSLLFVDTSRAGARRWCSMANCGNRAKVRDFRRRQVQGQDGNA
ncbi:MAG: ABATE domain-containing protein, partial [Acidobacteria bacterium]|nr:ABATE domain-containing protein [Acidobacteriota bacterium]